MPVRDYPPAESLICVLEQNTLYVALYCRLNPGRQENVPTAAMTEKSLTGT